MPKKRIAPDKMLLGVIVVSLVVMWIVGSMMKDEPAHDAPKQAQSSTEKAETADASAPSNPLAVDPKLATEFVNWWVGGAMDYNAATGQKSHENAFGWMTLDAKQTFEANFWPPELAEGIKTGQITAAFQPLPSQAQAVNPDGSVVVTMQGSLVLQANGRPITHQIMLDLLIKRDQDGLRVAGLYNRSYIVQTSQPY